MKSRTTGVIAAVKSSTEKPVKGNSIKSFLQSRKTKSVFVVQRHQATQLHYDFRLQAGAVLKSWALPKGPPLNAGDKRLAIMVEDHPLAYKDFEGIIPAGNYGAGMVKIWDKGTYAVINENAEEEKEEKFLQQALKTGNLKFVLKGKKLKGSFALVRMKTNPGGKENAWLLIKQKNNTA